MKKLELIAHFVTFFSPGTFVAEDSTLPIESWDIALAVKMAGKIIERYAARPYGFRFSTRGRGPKDLDSKIIKESGMYYLGGTVETLAQVKAHNDPNDSILISNMEINGYDRIVTNRNSWKFAQPLKKGDVVLDVKLPPVKNVA